MAKSQARRAQRAKDVVPHDLEDEEALHEGEDEAGISQKGLDRLMRALGPDSLGEMDMALLEQLRNDEDEEQDPAPRLRHFEAARGGPCPSHPGCLDQEHASIDPVLFAKYLLHPRLRAKLLHLPSRGALHL